MEKYQTSQSWDSFIVAILTAKKSESSSNRDLTFLSWTSAHYAEYEFYVVTEYDFKFVPATTYCQWWL